MQLTEPGATKHPIAGLVAQASFDWVVLNISNRIREMPMVANVTVEVVFHPELTTTIEDLIRLM
jgi:hypothetical protein